MAGLSGATSAAVTPSGPVTQRMPSSTSFQVARSATFERPRPSSVATNVSDSRDRTHPAAWLHALAVALFDCISLPVRRLSPSPKGGEKQSAFPYHNAGTIEHPHSYQ